VRIVVVAFLIALAGYAVGVLLGVGLVHVLSSKPDKSIEAVMTGFFAVGPVVAILTFIGAIVWLRSRRSAPKGS